MRPIDLRLYLVTDRMLCGARGVTSTVRAAVAGGVTAVQVRDRAADGHDLYHLAVELVAILAPSGVPLVVNDRIDVALAAGAQGTHLGQGDLPADRARAIAGPDHLIGWSATSAEMAPLAAWPPGTVDYLGVGPVWATPTKADAGSPIGLDGLGESCRVAARLPVPLPCVGIGGIDATNAAAVLEAGAAGVAVVSAICAAVDPAGAAAELAALVAGGRR